ncbi:MAG: hypothetical protein ACREAY_09375, partial [Nitrososphaera sp.]|uniref:hypothetical protein n=1 Tax=Nitrososphaera sp. TaxID=1971748 RepID=UPI003D6DC4E9
MEKTVVKYVKGLSADASSWEKRRDKKYGRLINVCRQIDYDIKHGVDKDQVIFFLEKVRCHSSFSDIRNSDSSLGRLDEIKQHFSPAAK